MTADLTTDGTAVLFEATSAPQRSWTPRGFLVLSALLGTASGTAATLFVMLGAWPVLGFLGLEVPVVLGLVALHHRRAGRASEIVSLSGETLQVSRVDARGRRQEARLEPYWARVELLERPGTAGSLRLRSRGRGVEIGQWLSLDEKQDLARALEEALRRYRQPCFNNPQLRD
ncbi:DUF2244 domain-containing protein [Roseomonas sp. BN140053]|uniref:DUF2244 domain-containing protein n=1 Tax=Roseomonas sp. BN140053 TaxID=3391898 RepID=UPI0039EBCF11